MATRPRERNTVTLRREDWQRIIDVIAGTESDPDVRQRLVVRLFVETGIDPTPRDAQ